MAPKDCPEGKGCSKIVVTIIIIYCSTVVLMLMIKLLNITMAMGNVGAVAWIF